MHKRRSVVGLAILVLVLGLMATPVLLRGSVAQQWSLDVEAAMDTIGVQPGMAVGEAGAGDGYFTFPLAQRVGAKGAVYANDLDSRALERLKNRAERERVPNIQTIAGEADDPLFPRKDLDLIVVVHAFHEFARPVEWLVKSRKYLKPAGTVALIDIDPERGGRNRSHFWPRERILGYAKQAGYEVVKVEDDRDEHLFVVLRPTPLGSSAR